LIVAPPGFGKTSLLADWAGIDGRSFAWVTVEPEDNDQAVLWSSIGTALGIALGGDGEEVDRLVASARDPDPAGRSSGSWNRGPTKSSSSSTMPSVFAATTRTTP